MASNPVVLFIVPDAYAMAYTAAMRKLSTEALASIGKEEDDVELIGYVSPEASYGMTCMYFLNRSGIDAKLVFALVLWGDAGDQFEFNSSRINGGVLGSVIIPEASASIPTLCIPSIDTGWAWNLDHWNSIKARYVGLLQNGRKELKKSDPAIFVTVNKSNWN